ncbi:MAG: hypothetical protein IPL08_09780, partial [Saprospiraceae bacterium]|nr:hypothetical protein [Saprospiraceae bacterium]
HESLLGALLDDQKYIYIITETDCFTPKSRRLSAVKGHTDCGKTAGMSHTFDIDTSSLLSTKGKSLEKLFKSSINIREIGKLKFKTNLPLSLSDKNIELDLLKWKDKMVISEKMVELVMIYQEKNVLLQPEEFVRQLLIRWLTEEGNIHKKEIQVEKMLILNGLTHSLMLLSTTPMYNRIYS